MYRMNGRYCDLATVGKITTKDKENGRIMRQYMSRTWINQTYMLYNCIVWNISINWHSYLVNHIVTWKLKICKWNKIHSWWKNNKLSTNFLCLCLITSWKYNPKLDGEMFNNFDLMYNIIKSETKTIYKCKYIKIVKPMDIQS